MALAAPFALAACGEGTVAPPQSAGFTPATRAPSLPQLDQPRQEAGVMGADARALTRLFGEPRLDIRDPAARKLQFTNGQCVLDAYLYPPRERREPVVTFAEARGANGAEMSWSDCAALLKQK